MALFVKISKKKKKQVGKYIEDVGRNYVANILEEMYLFGRIFLEEVSCW